MKTNHTHGEWVVKEKLITLHVVNEDSEEFDCINISSCDKNIVLIPTDWSKEESEANAKLIVAAPELLQSLIDLKSQLIDFGIKKDSIIVSSIEIAIKKATE